MLRATSGVSMLLLFLLILQLKCSTSQTTETHAALFPPAGQPSNMYNQQVGTTVTFGCTVYLNTNCPGRSCVAEAALLHIQWHTPLSIFSLSDGVTETIDCNGGRLTSTIAVQVTEDSHKNVYQCSYQMNSTHPCSERRGLKVYSRAAILTVSPSTSLPATTTTAPVSCDTPAPSTAATHVTSDNTHTNTQPTTTSMSSSNAQETDSTSTQPPSVNSPGITAEQSGTGSGVTVSPNISLLLCLLFMFLLQLLS